MASVRCSALLWIIFLAFTSYTQALVNPKGNPYQAVLATPAGDSGVSRAEAARSKKYLVSTFPDLKQVAYCQLPDNVWRPLVIGDLTSPKGVAVDNTNARLYVADPPEGKVYWMKLAMRPNGQLRTIEPRHVAVEGFVVGWLAVNGVGDLYFTGKALVNPPETSYDAVFRMDAAKIAVGNSLRPVELYTRSNTGNPNPKVWMPSGIAVDSFFVYWGNMESGDLHGSVVKGSRQNIGTAASNLAVTSLSEAVQEVRGMVSTGNTLYYLSPQGIYGVPVATPSTVTDPTEGLMVSPPQSDTNSEAFDPKGITWDGDGTVYVSDYTSGKVYSMPAMNTAPHNITSFVDGPGVWGMALMNFDMQSSTTRASCAMVLPFIFFSLTSLF